MKRNLVFISLLFLVQFAVGQKNNLAEIPPQPPTQKEMVAEERNRHCIKKANKNFSARLKNYPFNVASQIQLVSFKAEIDTSQFRDMKELDSLPRLNDTVCYSRLNEIIGLQFAQVDKLTDIFYNYGFGGPIQIGSISSCYYPKNAILFLDKNGEVFAYLEICFHCNATKKSSEKLSLGQMCDEKMQMLKRFFKSVGIQYGVESEVGQE